MSHATQNWDSRYPNRDTLRREAECLAECFSDELLALIPEGEIRAIYLKGSVVKRWESALDYVPEVSDVDMHIWFRDDAAWPGYLGTVSQALEVQAGVEARFAARVPRPLHEPRPQLIVMNKMMAEHEGFLHSPRSTVRVLYGEEYPEADYSDSAGIRRHDAAQLSARRSGSTGCRCISSTSPGATCGRRCDSWSGGSRRPGRVSFTYPGWTPSRRGA